VAIFSGQQQGFKVESNVSHGYRISLRDSVETRYFLRRERSDGMTCQVRNWKTHRKAMTSGVAELPLAHFLPQLVEAAQKMPPDFTARDFSGGTRLRLLHALAQSGELCVGELADAVAMKPQAVSN
jgi:Bacterial regulatory protein, arsR family